MAKTRVYELAKELNMSSKELLSILTKLGIKAKSHMSAIDDNDAADIRKRLLRPAREEKKPHIPIKKKKRTVNTSLQQKEKEKQKEKEQKRKDFEKDIGVIHLTEEVTLKELSEKLSVKSKDIQKALFMKGIIVSINQKLDPLVITDIVSSYGLDVEFVSFEEETVLNEDVVEEKENLEERAPVITIMGHVDHGKTLLLDSIRKTNVVDGEAGGITQHIGASYVEAGNKGIVFLDTPGHEAFTMMRARGASITDMVIIVVAADDGVMPQTEEAINHAKAAKVPIIVAVNKMDKPSANPDRVMQQLSERNLIPEEWGGDTIFVKVSAKTGEGIDELLEMILLVAEMEGYKANPNRLASGTILESHRESGRGVVASVLIHKGTLKIGDAFIAGIAFGKVKALFNDKNENISQAGPSTPVEVASFTGIPEAGDIFQVMSSEKEVKRIVNIRKDKLRSKKLEETSRSSLENLYESIARGEVKELNLILKCDVYGSTEVLSSSLAKLSTDKVKINIIHTGVGAINESDVLLASASNAVIIGFNIRPESGASKLASKSNVEIRVYDVIYEITKSIEDAMIGMLEPTIKETSLGRAEVRNIYKISKFGTIAGCLVTEGIINRKSKIRLIRDNIVVFDGKLSSLKRFKDDVKEVKDGYECGIGIENYNDIKNGDIIEAYDRIEIAPKSLG